MGWLESQGEAEAVGGGLEGELELGLGLLVQAVFVVDVVCAVFLDATNSNQRNTSSCHDSADGSKDNAGHHQLADFLAVRLVLTHRQGHC